MRFSSATLLLGGTSVLSALLASAAPVLIRISLIENDTKPAQEQDDYFRYVRIGAAGVPNVNPASDGESDLDRLHAALSRHSSTSEETSSTDGLPVSRFARIKGDGTPMRPDMEFTPTELDPELHALHTIVTICHNMSLWERMVGRINNFFVDMLGLSDESRRGTQCATQSTAQSVQVPPSYEPPKVPFVSATAPSAESTPYYRNGSPGPSTPSDRPRYRPWGRPLRQRPASFTQRVQRALYALSPWEGRAVAFVMGCGLGVLLRMLFVFTVLGARFLSSRKSQFAVALCGPSEDDDCEEGEKEKEGESVMMLLDDEEVEGFVLFDAGSLKGASVEDLPLYEEKQ